MDTDVLIIGAGPTGLMLACQLAKRNVRVAIVDRNPGPSVQTKALGVQARTLEIYAWLGIANQALELGKRASGASMWVKGKRVARVPLGDIGSDLSPFPFLLILGQDDNEKLLGGALKERGVEVQWNTALVDLAQTAEGVSASLKKSDGSVVEIGARWVAGCDGAHSAVRELCGIPFSGAPYRHGFYVADTRARGSMAPGQLNVYLWRGGFHLFFPMRGEDHWRVVGIVPPQLRSQASLDFDAVAPYVLREVGTAESGSALSFQDCSWFSTYHVHHRCADRFRDRRCFLLGDAAHIHSPVGAQGMNTGLQDAYNLAWKLALVVSGRADEGLLDSYEAERVPVARRLLGTTDRAFTFLISERWPAEIFRTRIFQRVIAFAMGRERTRKLAFRTISQIGIRYPGSPLSDPQSPLGTGAPHAGDRFPWLKLRMTRGGGVQDLFSWLDDTRFNLLLFEQSAPDIGWHRQGDGLLAVHVVPRDPDNDEALAAANIPTPSFYLLRPDGHVGLAGAELDLPRLNQYLAERVKLRRMARPGRPETEIATHHAA